MPLKISDMRMNLRKPGETHTIKQHFRKELGNSLDVESISIATLLPDQSNIVFHDPSQTHTKSQPRMLPSIYVFLVCGKFNPSFM